ncbi:MAG TPA: stage II sporulation protein M [Streptosporangiaceae bacterium]|nr:stage II sporulation protein M [Streptosporangiaceae bacterium]
MDVDAYVMAHAREWQRLEHLVSRRRRLSGPEVDELVALYQRVATHLSAVRAASHDPALVARLSTLVARARAAVTGAHTPAWRDIGRFWLVSFPAIAYRARWWWLGSAAGSLAVALIVGLWVARSPHVQAGIAPPAQIRQLVRQEFRGYYSQYAATSFAAKVWTNNVWVAALSLLFGVLLGIPTLIVLLQNAVNVGVDGGLMFAYGRGAEFFGLILPHGLLELTAVFLAAGAGLRLGWCVIDPGPRPRGQALAEEGRATIGLALGLVVVLLVSGVIEAFVTPSPLPTWARILIGAGAEAAFLTYVIAAGRRAVRAGQSGDIDAAPDTLPVAD